MGRRIVGIALAAALVLVFSGCPGKGDKASLKLKRVSYQPGEVISVAYVAPQGA